MKSSGYSTLRGSDTSITSMNINTTSFCNFSCYSDLQTKVDSIPIAHRVRRKRQRLPPSLLIENASDRDPHSAQKSASRRFRSRLAATLPLPDYGSFAGDPDPIRRDGSRMAADHFASCSSACTASSGLTLCREIPIVVRQNAI
jgi:hypothetical protein